MLYRSKYSRLRNDSVTSLEDGPQNSSGGGGGSLKAATTKVPPTSVAPDQPGLLDPVAGGSPPQEEGGSSTSCTFIPRMANIKISSPALLLGLRGLSPRLSSRSHPVPAASDCCPATTTTTTTTTGHHGASCPLAHNPVCVSSSCKANMDVDWCRLDQPDCGVSFKIKERRRGVKRRSGVEWSGEEEQSGRGGEEWRGGEQKRRRGVERRRAEEEERRRGVERSGEEESRRGGEEERSGEEESRRGGEEQSGRGGEEWRAGEEWRGREEEQSERSGEEWRAGEEWRGGEQKRSGEEESRRGGEEWSGGAEQSGRGGERWSRTGEQERSGVEWRGEERRGEERTREQRRTYSSWRKRGWVSHLPLCRLGPEQRCGCCCCCCYCSWRRKGRNASVCPYMGCLEVIQSMRALDFETRTQVTREAICRLCETVQGAKTALKKRKPPRKSMSAILGKSNLQFSGTNLKLSITMNSLKLTTLDSLQTVAHHPMQSISFASGGDPETADYVAYVAKDSVNGRACHILECPEGLVQEVINTIGEAFEKRFRQFLSSRPSLGTAKERVSTEESHRSPVTVKSLSPECPVLHGSHDYYNKVLGKPAPPGGLLDMRVELGELTEEDEGRRGGRTGSPPLSALYENCPLPQKQLLPPAEALGEQTGSETEVVEEEGGPPAEVASLPSASVPAPAPAHHHRSKQPLSGEGWYHGRLSRREAESRLAHSGDFLVRESCSAPGQYVLSGLQGAAAKHLLLMDPEGTVRTKDNVFQSVGHLIRYHMDSQQPIVSCGSELCLKQPVLLRQ
ncbi:hypothetical protein ACEWY4_015809 [Coilia grayii]|uniref:SHC-transforming protein 4 n=1 Tax=Coilia grayii TaxID=363190 RepID=A0ABD1JP27_9TELE